MVVIETTEDKFLRQVQPRSGGCKQGDGNGPRLHVVYIPGAVQRRVLPFVRRAIFPTSKQKTPR